MKKNILQVLMTLLCFSVPEVQANENPFYAKALVGANFLQNSTTNGNRTSYEPGYILSGSLGYRWCYGLRTEGEYAFRRNEIQKMHFFGEGTSKHGHFRTSSVMGNLLWDLPLASWGCYCWNIQPFVGAGIGYDYQKLRATNSRIDFDQTWNVFAWQLMVGLSYPIFCNAEATLEYRYHQGGCHFYNHSIGVGFVYNFGLFR